MSIGKNGTIVNILSIVTDFLIRFALWVFTHTIYRIRIVGQEHVPFRGPALLICNHMSYADGLLVGTSVRRFIRFMVDRFFYKMKVFNWFFRLMKVIPVSSHNRREIVESIGRARKELLQGHVVCIFAEGAISRTGNLLPFKRGFEKIVKGLDIPVIPVHLDQLWGSIFSFKGGKFFWKRPERIPYPVTISFGNPLPSTSTVQEVRQAVLELGSDAVKYRQSSEDLLQLRFIKSAKKHWFSFCMADSTGKEMTYGKALTGSMLLARWIKRDMIEESMIGILLPASIAGALANIAVLMAGKVPVNLNFTTGQEAMSSAVQQCGIRRIVTSRIFLKKAKLKEMEGMVFLEDVMKKITLFEKAWTALVSFLLPSRLLLAIYGRKMQKPDSLSTVIFSSGSTGNPKGIMLSHHNILSNIESLAQVFRVTKKDRLMGVLPFFHSFGFTGTLWFPLLTGFGVVYHSNPMDAKTIGEMMFKYKCTILISTPTFYAAYVRRCSVEEFSSLRYAIVGAEKLRESIAGTFKEKYGFDLLEGYGCTEMGPVVSVNIPDIKDGPHHQTGLKHGTVGHPIPGVSVKVVDCDTGEPLPCCKEGMLLVRGPNRMVGYLGQTEKTEAVLKNGWYITGDIASIDEDGFIRITDRLSRFSKIGGEMVPHIRVEEVINRILGDHGCVITSIPDEQKGECLVVLHTHKEITPDELSKKLSQTDIPKLWIPGRKNIYYIESIPVLGTGKVNLREVRMIAVEKTDSARILNESVPLPDKGSIDADFDV